MFAGRHESLSADAHNASFSSLVPRVRVIQSLWPVPWLSAGLVLLVLAHFSPRTPCWHRGCCRECVQPHWSCYQLEDACQCCILVFSFPFDQVCLLLRCFSYITLPLQAALHVAFPAVSVITCLCTILPGSCCAVCRNSHLLACSQI